MKKFYFDRLNFEVDVINQMGYAGYFLIVSDFINWSKQNNIPVGPGRGSGAGSVVAYSLGITDLDPIEYNLLFERFLNPDRVSMPDFDIDFCQEGRDQVIDYVKEKYGAESVSQIATFGTMAARAGHS
jgi:DNA polymerase-3 subunit alpha